MNSHVGIKFTKGGELFAASVTILCQEVKGYIRKLVMFNQSSNSAKCLGLMALRTHGIIILISPPYLKFI